MKRSRMDFERLIAENARAWERTQLVQARVGSATSAFMDAHASFIARLEQIATALDHAE
jgi:hypothetical protein